MISHDLQDRREDGLRSMLLQVSAYVTAAQIRFLLLHDGRSDDSIRSFFRDVHETYLRVMLNPFFIPTAKIRSPGFDLKVRSAARQYFKV